MQHDFRLDHRFQLACTDVTPWHSARVLSTLASQSVDYSQKQMCQGCQQPSQKHQE